MFDFDYVVSGSFTEVAPSDRESFPGKYRWTATINKQLPTTSVVGRLEISYNMKPESDSNGQIRLSDFDAGLMKVRQVVLPLPSAASASAASASAASASAALPIFAVIDHNSAHHMSYVLANWAFSTFGHNRKKVVINFDHHIDKASVKRFPRIIRCGDWAQHLFLPHDEIDTTSTPAGHKTIPALKPFYIWVGGSSEGETSHVFVSEGAEPEFSADALTSTNTGLILDKIRLFLCVGDSAKGDINDAWSDIDVYITVDRDFMIGSYTPYGDGPYSADVGRKVVMDCLKKLDKQSANLVGFDVIGLPVKAQGTDEILNQAAVDQSILDVRSFHSWVSDYARPPVSATISAAIAPAVR
jgi:hypothetical protein